MVVVLEADKENSFGCNSGRPIVLSTPQKNLFCNTASTVS